MLDAYDKDALRFYRALVCGYGHGCRKSCASGLRCVVLDGPEGRNGGLEADRRAWPVRREDLAEENKIPDCEEDRWLVPPLQG